MNKNSNWRVEKLGELLKPNVAKDKYILISMYICFFESLKNLIIDNVKYFFINEIKNGEIQVSKRYESEVLSLSKSKSPLYASLKWLKKNDAIGETDIDNFNNIKRYRNKLTHEMMAMIFEGDTEEIITYYNSLIEWMIKLDRWWVLNIEIPTSGMYTESEIDFDNVVTGSEMLVKLLTDLVMGEEDAAKVYYDEFYKTNESFK